MKFKFPGIKIIDRYIIRKFLGTYLFAIGMIIVVVVIFDAAERMDDFIEMKAPLSKIIFQYYLNFIPFFINQFSALFTFIAVIFFTSKMAYNTEVIAILSGGVSFNRFLWPYFLSAMAIALLSLTLNLYLIPSANEGRINFQMNYFKKSAASASKYDPHIYRQVEPGTFVYIRNFNGDRNGADYIALETYEEGIKISSLEAANPVFDPESGRWTAPQSIRRAFEGEKEIFDNTKPLDTVIDVSAMELGRVEEFVKTMNTHRLNQFIRQQRLKGSDQIDTFEVERQTRYAMPIATFILTLIAVCLSSRKMRGGTGIHIGVGIALCFSYILFSTFFSEFAKSGTMNPTMAVWLPNVIYSFIAVYLYIRAPK